MGVSRTAPSLPSEVFNVLHVQPRGHTLKAFNERASSHLRRSTLPGRTNGIRREKDAPARKTWKRRERKREDVGVTERGTVGWSECRWRKRIHAAFAHSHSPGYVPQVIRSSRRDAPVQTRPGNVSARILKRNQFATSARYLAASSALIIAIHEACRPSCIFSQPNIRDCTEKTTILTSRYRLRVANEYNTCIYITKL